MSAEEKLRSMGLSLPEAPKPVAAYVPAVVTGDMVFISGQLPVEGGKLKYAGKLGKDLTVEQGYEAARLCGINVLSALRAAAGTLDRVTRIVRLCGYVASAEGFTDQPKVVNGASELFVQLFGDTGRHARAAVGVTELPMGAAVELEAIALISDAVH